MTPILHTPEEAGKILRCKASWLRDKAQRREIPFTLIGGAYRFSDAHLEWIVNHFEVAPRPHQAPAPRVRPAPEPAPVSGPAQLKARRPRRLRAAS